VASGGDHLVGGRVLGHERRGAGLQRREQLLVPGVHGEHHDAGLVPAGPDVADQVEPRAVGQAYVGHHDVRLQVHELLEPLADRGSVAGHLEVVGPLERPSQALTDQVMVVDEEHAGAGVGQGRPSVRGRAFQTQ
jgi:hypothetical protein